MATKLKVGDIVQATRGLARTVRLFTATTEMRRLANRKMKMRVTDIGDTYVVSRGFMWAPCNLKLVRRAKPK